MGGITAQAQVDKKCYRNQTAGWLGVTKLDHLGAQVGVSIEPYGTAYLSHEEAVLTARAPKDPKDNPFVEQQFMFEDAAGNRVSQGMRPLVLVEDPREVPTDDRYVPLAPATDEGEAARVRETEAALAEGTAREVPTDASVPTLVPSSGAAVPPSQARATPAPDGSRPAEPEEDVRESWVDNEERTLTPQQGALGGSNEPVVTPPEGDAATTGSPTALVPQPPVQQVRAQSSVEPAQPEQKTGGTVPSESAGVREGAGSPSEQGPAEEHAGVTDKGEETGAADTPVGDPPEGEYASHEEVGSPEAPAATTEDTVGP